MNKRHITSLISQVFGKFASKEFSPRFQGFINNTYVGLMGLDMSDFNDRSTYNSLNALFTRSLREKREFSKVQTDFISPCDSYISECGDLNDEDALQIKGMKYDSHTLLGENFSDDEKSIVDNGKYINFYLSPKDYHRYHIPTDLQVLKAVHIPGKFYPVNISSLKTRVNLFIENERVVILCKGTDGKKFYMILVAALNVGVMQVSFEPNIKTNSSSLKPTLYEYEDLHLKKGDDFGCFEMGSTIVILAQKDMLELENIAYTDVKYAQTIARII